MDSTTDFRPKMRHLGELSTREVQIVFLIATLSPYIEPEFMRTMKVQPEDVHIFQAPITRPNIAYSVFEYNASVDETDAICRLVEEKLEQYVVLAKIIVYSRTIERTKELSQVLGCHEYYREVRDREVKEQIIERWQYGDRRVIVATNAFRLGIDAPDIRVVIHAGDIY